MIVTDIIEISKKQCKIMIDYEFAFVLYKGELHLYGIKKDVELPDEVYTKIINEVLTKRCKLRAMNLLKERAYSEKKLYDKLLVGQYPMSCIEETLRYVKSYGYINDLQYAQDYLFYHGKTLNKRQAIIKLKQRGITDDIIREAYLAFEESGEMTSEEELIHRQLSKKHFVGVKNCDFDERNKVLKSLLQKGFSYDISLHAMQTFDPSAGDICT